MLLAGCGSHAALHEPLLCVFRATLLAACGSCAGALHEPLLCVFRSTLLATSGSYARVLHEPLLCVFRSTLLAICAERFISRCCVCLDQRYWQFLEAVVLQARGGLPEDGPRGGVHTTAPLLPPSHPQYLLGAGGKDLTATDMYIKGDKKGRGLA